ncbi:shikimate kinase [Propionibacterium sp.]|uniref:shikimate kinase n=1 Tax=Propionibacterium sp. TaxID=1977903 RepID=UPI0039E9F9E2
MIVQQGGDPCPAAQPSPVRGGDVGAAQVVLVGPPGVGKSSVGQALAARHGLAFVDADRFLEEREGRAVTEIFASQGEAGFRALELEVTRELLERDGIVALGGGAVTNPAVRDLLSGHQVVWLDMSVEEGVRRIADSTHRPLLRGDVAGKLATLIAEREALYREVAVFRVCTDGLATHEVAAAVSEMLGWPVEQMSPIVEENR